EAALAEAVAQADRSREAERQAAAVREDALRLAGNLSRESADAEVQLARLDEELGGGRARLAELEVEQEAAREQRVHWQVQEAHVAGGLRSADERVERATRVRGEAEAAALALAGELGQLDA